MHFFMQAWRLSYAIIALVFPFSAAVDEQYAMQGRRSVNGIYIKNDEKEQRVVNEGSTVKMQCDIHVPTNSKIKLAVIWKFEKLGGDQTLAVNSMIDGRYRENIKVDILKNGETQSWILTIENIKVSEDGFYRCELFAGQSKHNKRFRVEVIHIPLSAQEEIVAIKNEMKELKEKVWKIGNCTEAVVGFTAYAGPGTHYFKEGDVAMWKAPDFNMGWEGWLGRIGDYYSDPGEFYCRIPGWYRFSVNMVTKTKYNGNMHIMLRRATSLASTEIIATAWAEQDDWNTAATSAVIELQVEDVVWLQAGEDSVLYDNADDNGRHNNVKGNIFSGHLIKAAACYE